MCVCACVQVPSSLLRRTHAPHLLKEHTIFIAMHTKPRSRMVRTTSVDGFLVLQHGTVLTSFGTGRLWCVCVCVCVCAVVLLACLLNLTIHVLCDVSRARAFATKNFFHVASQLHCFLCTHIASHNAGAHGMTSQPKLTASRSRHRGAEDIAPALASRNCVLCFAEDRR